MFIEDYLAKALDPFPARACMALPDIASVAPTVRFKGREVDVKPVAFGAMKETERRHLLQAFVRTTYHDIIDCSNKKLMLKEYEALYCVHEYYRGLYGAVIAQCYGSWLPDRQADSSHRPDIVDQTVEVNYEDLPPSKDYGLLYPDNVYFDADLYSFNI
ncbi:hypothetical protein FSARC_764, partial [Fusarium sarcochroum]